MKLALAIAILALGAIIPAAYETTYTDDVGATCAAFGLGRHEAILCTGRTDR